MSLTSILTSLFACLTVLMVGCAGPPSLAVRQWPDELPADEELSQEELTDSSGSAKPDVTKPDNPSLDQMVEGLEALRDRNPEEYDALLRQLSPVEHQLMPRLAATLNHQAGSAVSAAPPIGSRSTATTAQPAPNHVARRAPTTDTAIVAGSAATQQPAATDPLAAADTSFEPALQHATAPAAPATLVHEEQQPATGESLETADEPPPIDETGEPGQWKEAYASAVEQLEKELVWGELDDDERVQLEATLRLLYVIGNRRDKAVTPITQLDDDEREYWKHQLFGLIVSLDLEGRHAPTRRAALALREVRTATDHLANISALDVRNLAFCTDVFSYGRYREFKSNSFRPGQEVVLYVEVENFAAEVTGDQYETELLGEYTIVDSTGQRIISRGLPLDKQSCKNRRRDYFIAYKLFLPAEMDSGEYTLVLTMEDVKGHKSNRGSIEFRIQ